MRFRFLFLLCSPIAYLAFVPGFAAASCNSAHADLSPIGAGNAANYYDFQVHTRLTPAPNVPHDKTLVTVYGEGLYKDSSGQMRKTSINCQVTANYGNYSTFAGCYVPARQFNGDFLLLNVAVTKVFCH